MSRKTRRCHWVINPSDKPTGKHPVRARRSALLQPARKKDQATRAPVPPRRGQMNVSFYAIGAIMSLKTRRCHWVISPSDKPTGKYPVRARRSLVERVTVTARHHPPQASTKRTVATKGPPETARQKRNKALLSATKSQGAGIRVRTPRFRKNSTGETRYGRYVEKDFHPRPQDRTLSDTNVRS
eukprot:1180489-Prorocentrum_minimum.AAC.2